MQPADGLVAGPGQVTMPFSPGLQHYGVVLGEHRARGLRPQRRNRHRPGIIRVVLVRVTGFEQPHPGSQLGRHIHHLLTGGDQLLGQQAPQPGRALHRPGPLRPAGRPRHQPLRLRRAGPYPHPAQRMLARADRDRGVRALVRVNPNHHCRHRHTPHHHRGQRLPRRACLITVLALAPLSSHTTARPDRLAPRYQARPSTAGRRFGSPAHRASQRYGPGSLPSRPDPQRLPQVSIRRILARQR
jgi:hypothetical protein